MFKDLRILNENSENESSSQNCVEYRGDIRYWQTYSRIALAPEGSVFTLRQKVKYGDAVY